MRLDSLRHPRSATSLAWLLVLALTTAPTMSGGRFVCMRRMAEAYPSCPKCQKARPVSDRRCCRWIESAPANAVHVASTTLEPPSSHWLSLCEQPAAIAIDPAAGFAAAALHCARPPGESPPRTTILLL